MARQEISGLSTRKRIAFWAATLAVPALVLVAIAPRARQAISESERPSLARISQAGAEAVLAESARTEVHVVTVASLKGMVRPSVHEDLVYELKPNSTWLFLGTEVRTDGRGFRLRDGAAPNAPSPRAGFRVVGLGDSIMWGWGIAESQTYLRLLEAPLSAAVRTPGEVVNLAVPTYNTLQEAAVLERFGMRPTPDLVVVGFTSNDGAPPAFGGFSSPARLRENERLLGRAAELLPADLAAHRTDLRVLRVAAGLSRIRALTEPARIPVALLVYPYDSPDIPRRLAEANGFHYVDLYPAFEELRREAGVEGLHELATVLAASKLDRHPGPDAHEVVARQLLPTAAALLAKRSAALQRAPP